MPDLNNVQLSMFGDDPNGNPGLNRPRKPGPWLAVQSTRLQRARYDSVAQQVHVIFRDGTPYTYDQVAASEWRNFRRAKSKGKAVTRILDPHPYWRGGFDYTNQFDTVERDT